MPTLVLIRHGATQWNERDLFAGWGDAPLSAEGEAQARAAGRAFSKSQLSFDLCHTSRLIRARGTLDLILEEMGAPNVPIDEYWRLNERHYGALQGIPRKTVIEEYGREATIAWRRTYAARPPPLPENDARWLAQVTDYADVAESLLPRCESLADGVRRTERYWHETLAPLLRSGKDVLIAAHTSPIRGLVHVLDGLDERETESFRIPAALPVVYDLDDKLAARSRRRLYAGAKDRWRAWRSGLKPKSAAWM